MRALLSAAAGVLVLAACTDAGRSPTAPAAVAGGSRFSSASATGPCTFTVKNNVMRLDGDCVTSTSVVVPNGFTLDGANHAITAVDPAGGHFVGGVVTNGGATANVSNVTIRASGLADVCDAGADRLRGILFDHASGHIDHNTVTDINQGPSGCQEGNAIEVRNFDPSFDPATPRVTVEIDHNTVDRYQKTGIVCNGGSDCSVHHNIVGASSVPVDRIAANSIQFGFGGGGSIDHNNILGNQWCGTSSDDAATAILLYESAPGLTVDHNDIGGNSDIAIWVGGDHATITHNTVTDSGPDCNASGYDIGIGNYGDDTDTPAGSGAATNVITFNQVSGFTTPFDPPVSDGHNHLQNVKPHK